MTTQSKGLTWAGWILTGLVAAMLTFSASMKFIQPEGFAAGFTDKFGYPIELAVTIGVLELACMIVYLNPRTAILGAILLTGYLGGAVATHVRVNDGMFFPPVLLGVFAWLGVYLRDPRVRALTPFVSPMANRQEP